MPLAPDRLIATRPVARPGDAAFARRGAAAKVAEGWGKAIGKMPGDALTLAGKAVGVVAHPVKSVQGAWAGLQANPMAAVVPVAMTAGMVAASLVAPRLMRVVGWAMTASIAVLPTWRFARATSAAELDAASGEASKQVVNVAASMAAFWAAGKAIRWGVERFRGPEPAVATEPAFSTERGRLRPPARKGATTPTDVDPDAIDFGAVRNDREAGAKLVATARTAAKDELFAAAKAAEPGLTRAKFEGRFRAAGGGELRAAYTQAVRRRVHGGWLEAHGVKVPAEMAGKELAGLRRHLQDLDDAYDVADAVKGLNLGLAGGSRDATAVATAAERYMWRARGVPVREFDRIAARMTPADLKRLRRFADSWATAQGGRYLRVIANAKGVDPLALERTMAARLAGDMGFRLPKGAVDHRTVLSLLRDLEPEGPRTTRAIIQAVNDAVAAGETDYHRLNAIANRAVLRQLGVPALALGELEASDKALRAAFPDVVAAEARAAQTRLLRDALRVLPTDDRAAAVAMLRAKGATLVDFDGKLGPWLDRSIAQAIGGNKALAGELTAEASTMLRANLLTGLRRLPADVREATFAGLQGDPARQARTAAGRLAKAIEATFDVKVHREAGAFPIKGYGYEPHVKGWTVQGLVDLHNAVGRMAIGGQLPKAARGTTFVRMVDGPDGASMTPGQLRPHGPATPTHASPGGDAYPGGTMGEAMQNARGKDVVVLYDAALATSNADEAAGIAAGEGTLIHEIGHAIQLGGPAGKAQAVRDAAERRLVGEWSTLSGWHEADGAIADRFMGDVAYYKHPAVRVAARRQVATAYAATDPIEDFAEYARFFYNDPATAMRLSPEKFVYFNDMVGKPYAADKVQALGAVTGLDEAALARVARRVATKIAGAEGRAVNRPNRWATAG